MEWQPIETAPTDGTEVLVCRVYEGERAEYAVAGWDGQEWRDMETLAGRGCMDTTTTNRRIGCRFPSRQK